MRIRGRWDFLPVMTMVVTILAGPGSAIAGPVILGAESLPLRGSRESGVNKGGWLYIERALEGIESEVTRSGPFNIDVVVLGSSNTGCPASGGASCDSGDAGAAIGSAAFNAGLSVYYVEGSAAISSFFVALAAGNVNPKILWMPGIVGDNALDSAEGGALTANVSAIEAFVASGGGLMSHGYSSTAYGWLHTLLPALSDASGCTTAGARLTEAGMTAFPGLGNYAAGFCIRHFEGSFGDLEVLVRDGSLGQTLLPGTGVTVTETEYNDSAATADVFAIGDDYAGENSPLPYEADWVGFAANGGEVIVATTVLGTLGDSTLGLVDTDGVTGLASDDDHDDDDDIITPASRITFTLPDVAGTYFLVVRRFAALRYGGTYTLQLRGTERGVVSGRPYIIGGADVAFQPCAITLDDPDAEPLTGTVSEYGDSPSGIASVELVSGFNLSATIDSFGPGEASVGFSVARDDTNLLAQGVIEGTTATSVGPEDVCDRVVQIGSLGPDGNLARPPGRDGVVRVTRPTPDTEGMRCVETGDPNNPDYAGIPFVPFTEDELEFEVPASNATSPFICCLFEDDQGAESIQFCEAINLVCDIDGDHFVDRNDLFGIFAARETAATGPDDPMDFDGDGLITVGDSIACILECSSPKCVPASAPGPLPKCGLIGLEPLLLLGIPLWRRRARKK